MKNNFKRFLFPVLILLLVATGSYAASPIKPVGSSFSTLTYDRTLNPDIGITADYSAVGSTYTITNASGKVVMSGTIKSGKTFYIPTGKLDNGMYRFEIGGQVLQQFVIK